MGRDKKHRSRSHSRHRTRSRSRRRSRSADRRSGKKHATEFDRRLSRLETLILSIPEVSRQAEVLTVGESSTSAEISKVPTLNQDDSARSRKVKRTAVEISNLDEAKRLRNKSPRRELGLNTPHGNSPGRRVSPPRRESKQPPVESESPAEGIELSNPSSPEAESVLELQDDTLLQEDVPEGREQDPLTREFLSSIGITPSHTETPSIDISLGLLDTWTNLMFNGLERDQREALLGLYRPGPSSESAGFKVPVLNPEVASALSHPARFSDTRSTFVQDRLLSTLTALAAALKTVAALPISASTEKQDLGTALVNAGKICADTFHLVSIQRREALYPLLSKNLKDVAMKVPPKNCLFGESVIDDLKKQKSLETLGRDLKAVSQQPARIPKKTVQGSASKPAYQAQARPSSSSLNSRGSAYQRGGMRSTAQNRYPTQRPSFRR